MIKYSLVSDHDEQILDHEHRQLQTESVERSVLLRFLSVERCQQCSQTVRHQHNTKTKTADTVTLSDIAKLMKCIIINSGLGLLIGLNMVALTEPYTKKSSNYV